jgi:hypothetical protein
MDSIMIQKFLTKYWLAFHVLALFFVMSIGFFRVERQTPSIIFWFSLFAIEALLLLPTVFKTESLVEARRRVLRALEDDAFTYVGLLLVGLVSIQWLNSGCALVYFPDADIWKYGMPRFEWLPYSIESKPALILLSVVVALFSGVLVIRNGLGKGGRRFFLEAASLISGGIAIFTVLKSHTGVLPYSEWALQPAVCNPGAFFAFWFFIALGWDFTGSRSTPSGGFVRTLLWWCFAFVGNLAGLLQFSTGVGVIIFCGVGVVLLLYRGMILRLQSASAEKKFRFVIGILVSVSLVVGTIVFFPPASSIKSKVLKVAEAAHWSDVASSRQLRVTAALKIWEEAPWTGVGPHGFSYYLGTVIKDVEWKQVKADRRFVCNDALQFLCEWGVIGSGILIALVIIQLTPLFIRLRNLFTRPAGDENSAWDDVLFLDGYCVPSVVALVTLLVYGWFSSLFQHPVTFLSWFFVLALVPGLLPSSQSRKTVVRGKFDE